VWTDAHCHIPYEGVGEEVIADARAEGVSRLVTVGTDLASSRAALDVARRHPAVWSTAGVHPHDAAGGIDGIEALLAQPEVVAVGECGLDYHYDHSPREVQRDVFAAQIALAHTSGLALVIHTREAWDDTFAILRSEGVPERTVFHCFTGGPEEARQCLDLGAFLSFSGIVSFKTADDVRAAAVLCPLDRMTVETDSPYLAPEPFRGKPNEPALVPLVGAALAAARGTDEATIARLTRENAARVFKV
jgi:TatD DNase family protein